MLIQIESQPLIEVKYMQRNQGGFVRMAQFIKFIKQTS